MNKRIPIFLGLLLIIFAVWSQITTIDFFHSFITRLNNLAYDVQMRTEIFTHKAKPTTPIAIIDIDDKSLQAIGRWPWPRDKMGALVNRLSDEGAVVIALDTLFSEPETDIAETMIQELTKRNLSTPAFISVLKTIKPELNLDQAFAKSLKDKDTVLGISFIPRPEQSGTLPPPLLTLTNNQKKLELFEWKGYISNVPVLQTAARASGFINVIPDQDGIIRSVPLLMRYQGKVYGSLALVAVNLFLLSNVSLVIASYDQQPELEAVKLGSHIIPTNAQAQMLVPYIGKSFSFPYYSAVDVLNKKLPANALAGKIVFIGTSATGLGDLRATAIESVYPGVEVQATIANAILTDRYSFRPAWTVGAEVALTVLLGLILACFFPYLGPRSLTFLAIFLPAALIFINNMFWEKTGLVIFILIPIVLTLSLAILNIAYGYLFETLKRERIKAMFGQYVPEKHIDEMLKESGNFGLHGEDREMTVLFADIRNFTSISEPMTASDLKDLLNQFFTPMTEIIFTHKGTIDKYIGDLIMAFWGAPLKDKRHAQHAIVSALEMQTAVDKLKPIFAAKGWAEINIGIGLNSGIMSVGDMGSQFRRNYTVLGDAVNLASRVESLTKFYGVKIMTTEATIMGLNKRFLFRQLDRVRVKGKKNGIAIYEVICHLSNASAELLNEVLMSENALAIYFAQRWTEAEAAFLELHQAHPDVKLYELYLKRIGEFTQEPPAPDWDGVYAHASK